MGSTVATHNASIRQAVTGSLAIIAAALTASIALQTTDSVVYADVAVVSIALIGAFVIGAATGWLVTWLTDGYVRGNRPEQLAQRRAARIRAFIAAKRTKFLICQGSADVLRLLQTFQPSRQFGRPRTGWTRLRDPQGS